MHNVGEIISAYSGLAVPQAVMLMAFIFAALAAIGWFVSSYGIQTKWFTVGGSKKDLEKQRHDTALKEVLKKATDEIDREAVNELYDLAHLLSRRFDEFLGSHCYFTLYALSDTLFEVFKNRIRRNNLKNKLSANARGGYAAKITNQLHAEYENIRAKAAVAECREAYPQWGEVEGAVGKIAQEFVQSSVEIEREAIRKKIGLYTAKKAEFQSGFYRKQSCEEPLERNRKYLAALDG